MSVYYLLSSLFYEMTRCDGVEGVEDGEGVNGVKDGDGVNGVEDDGECDGGILWQVFTLTAAAAWEIPTSVGWTEVSHRY